MKYSVLILLLLGIAQSLSGQRIEAVKKWGGYVYGQEGKTLNMGQVVNAMSSHPEAQTLMQKAKSTTVLTTIIGGAGGALVGYPIGTAIGGGDANWTLAGIGAGLIIVSIPLVSKANKNAKAAVDLYNAALTSIRTKEDFQYSISMHYNSQGLGFQMRF